jgi:hypothetical protein
MSSPYRSSHDNNHRSRSSDSSNIATSGSDSTIRPRNRRLVSTELRTTSPDARVTPSTRGLSPIPSKHPSRTGVGPSSEDNGRPIGGLVVPRQDGGRGGRSRSGSPSPTTLGFGRGLWEGGWQGSWTALQGLANSVLGGDVGDSVSEGEGSEFGRNGVDAAKKKTRGGGVRTKAPATWGPSGLRKRGDSIGAGSSEARDTAFKARKTASVLESYDGVNGGLDINGNYKRRTSLDNPGHKVEEEDVLVYVHYVQPQDTLAGVVLKYNCQPATFRKANRLWPNDAIQIRKVVLLPVDACAVKGKPCDPPLKNRPIDLPSPKPVTEDPNIPNPTNGSLWEQAPHDRSSLRTDAPYAEPPNPDEDEQAWTHVRWVLLDSSPSAKPIEIARLPRKTLGYFPPRRRKSHATSISTVSTPRDSFDHHSAPQNGLFSDTPGETIRPGRSLDSKPDTGSYFHSATSSLSPGRGSTSEASLRPKWLKGPGGVGTLAKNVRKPGPAQDGLNSWAARHAPSLTIGDMPSSSAVVSETATFGFSEDPMSLSEGFSNSSGAITPAGQRQEYGQGLGLEQAAAAIEGWVRKLAIKAPGTPRTGPGGKAIPEVVDLIELLDGTGSDDGRSFEPAGGSSSKPHPPQGLSGGWREEQGAAATFRDRMMMAGKGKSD